MTKTLNISDDERALLTPEELAGMEEGQEFDEGQGNSNDADDAASAAASADDGKKDEPADDGKKADDGKAEDDSASASADDATAAAADDGAKNAAAAAAATDTGAEADAGAADELAGFVTVPPLPVAKLPDDFADKVKAVETDKKTLSQQLDEGDISMSEYHEKLDALNKQERELERTKDRVESSEQRRYETWTNVHVIGFMGVHPEYQKNEMLTGLLDQEVRKLQAGGKYTSDTDPQILLDAHKKIAASFPGAFTEHGKAPTKGKEPAKQPQQHKTVPTLARTPASDIDEPGEGEFSGLDRLLDTDSLAWERACEQLAKSDPAKYDRYLASQ